MNINRVAILVGVLTLALTLVGQESGGRFSSTAVDTDPTPIPASLTTVFTGTVYVQEVTLTNITGADVTCTIQDRQATPRALYNNVVKPGLYVFSFKGRKMPNGVAWFCGDSTSVVGYIQGVK
jgi:hypothetical protein